MNMRYLTLVAAALLSFAPGFAHGGGGLGSAGSLLGKLGSATPVAGNLGGNETKPLTKKQVQQQPRKVQQQPSSSRAKWKGTTMNAASTPSPQVHESTSPRKFGADDRDAAISSALRNLPGFGH